jgi:type II secretory pathway component PulK
MIVVALACLLVVTSIVVSMLQGTMRTRRQLHSERDRRQNKFLLQAGADRAAGRLAAEPDFRGDTWNLSANAITGQSDGRVTTEISPNAGNQGWLVHVLAEYPVGREFTIRRTQVFQISTATTPAQE